MRVHLLVPLVVLLLAGCGAAPGPGAPPPAPGATTSWTPASNPFSGTQPGTQPPPCPPEATAPETRQLSAVSVRPSSGRFVAERTETLTQGLGCQVVAAFDVRTANGGVTVTQGSRYQVEALYRAWGDTAAEAEASLDGLGLRHDVQDVQGGRAVAVEGLAEGGWASRSVGLTLRIPAEVAVGRLAAQVQNGGFSASGLSVPEVDVQVDNGGVSLALQAPWASGSWTAHADNGGVSVRLQVSPSHGYDVTAQADNGGVAIRFPEGEAVGSQTPNAGHWRTKGFASRPIQTVLGASAGNGGVSVGG